MTSSANLFDSPALPLLIELMHRGCFSCGAALPEPRYGRCRRCSLAWRLAVGVPIPAEWAAAYDGARVVA